MLPQGMGTRSPTGHMHHAHHILAGIQQHQIGFDALQSSKLLAIPSWLYTVHCSFEPRKGGLLIAPVLMIWCLQSRLRILRAHVLTCMLPLPAISLT